MEQVATKIFHDEISIVLCGQAGMGIQTVENLLTRLLKQRGFHLFATKEYMSRVRGGNNSTLIRIGSHPVHAWVAPIDILIPLNRGAIDHLGKRLSPDTILLADEQALGENLPADRYRCLDVPLTRIATEIGNKLYSNIVAIGLLSALFGLEEIAVDALVSRSFAKRGPAILEQNIKAARSGHALGVELVSSGQIRIDIAPTQEVRDHLFLSGGDAIGLGALAGGCNFVASYPMSPSTPVLTFMAQQASQFGLIVEQAEDEIAAINMILGAWYTGARGLATTSGGGFSLMAEGMSLAGMIESPAVIHLAQRPGPATGLPTRTEQGDFNLALYAGHGEFPRILLAPGTLQQGHDLMCKAFDMADRFQSPVIVLTDQYFIDSYYDTTPFDLPGDGIQQHIVETSSDYRRHEITDDGISPRGIPGFGNGLVGVDSDEHDQAAHITEDHEVRVAMNDKRLRKLHLIRDAAIPPELWPNPNYADLVLCWGSTYWIVREALQRMSRPDMSLLHFSQVYPLHPDTGGYLRNAARIILVEGNATGQFGDLIKTQTGIEAHRRILKYDGLPFSVEEVVAKLREIVGEGS